MLRPTLVSHTSELEQILQLQQQNLLAQLSEEEKQTQGFVTMHHDLDTLRKMHNLSPSVIIKKDDVVVAYALTMLKECRQLMPALDPMFSLFDKLQWKDKPLNQYRYYVMGQICVDKMFRGKGFVESLYQHHKKIYQSQFDLILTEIATRNTRSIRAHEKVGFTTIHTHKDELDEWAIVGWDWE